MSYIPYRLVGEGTILKAKFQHGGSGQSARPIVVLINSPMMNGLVIPSEKYYWNTILPNGDQAQNMTCWTVQDKKEEIWPSAMTKALTPTEMSKG